MSCNQCGQQTTRARLCAECARMERAEEASTAPLTTAPGACAQCDGTADDGGYAPRDPGVWLCSDCLDKQAVACDGGQR